MKVLLIDNYDSFTFNLAQMLEESSLCNYSVKKNDQLTLRNAMQYDKIMISPGAGLPEDAGNTLYLIKELAAKKDILGICLGHQAIAVAFGARLKNLLSISHGEASLIRVVPESDCIFENLPLTFDGGRYHSWVVDHENLPDCLTITAFDHQGNIMALKHRTLRIRGIQFHPESILTPFGSKIIENWLKYC